jgi:uncharacterized membrane protein
MTINLRGKYIWEGLKSSLWFLPSIMVTLSMIGAYVTTKLDERADFEQPNITGFVFGGHASGAQEVLSTIASSMITVAGVVFSITIVALSLASQQFGPRLLRNFMRDRGNQLVLGTFISTYVFCLLVLRTVRSGDDAQFIPNIGVTTALGLAIVSLAVLIYYIHHIAESINASHLIGSVHDELVLTLHELYPRHLGDAAPVEEARAELPENFDAEAVPIVARESGYVAGLDADRLLQAACEADLIIRLAEKPGRYVQRNAPIAFIWPEVNLTQRSRNDILASIEIGRARTPTQDPEFLVDQLVEVALRALSPSLNDPFTAVTCIDHLGDALARLAGRAMPSPYRNDSQGNLRVVTDPLLFGQMMDGAFSQIRQSGGEHPAVVIRLLEVLMRLVPYISLADRIEDVERHGRMIAALIPGFPEELDRRDAEQRVQALESLLQSKRAELITGGR